ncbi:MAG: M28 family peptidase, partial [Syntrophorhabdales bacterium]
DGGSSTAILLEYANQLRGKKRDGYSVWLIWTDGEEAVRKWSDTDSLYGGIHQIATAIEEMSATTDEITRDINHISAVTRENFSFSEEISGAAAGLSGLARTLEQDVSGFKVSAQG